MKFFQFVVLLSSTKKLIHYLLEQKLLRRNILCECSQVMNMKESTAYPDGVCFWCNGCKKRKSIRTESFFEGRKLSLEKIVSLLYFLNLDVLYKNIADTLEVDEHVVYDYAQGIRVLRGIRLNEVNIKLGGPGIRVQVDESLFSKSKNTRNGHARPVERNWILGFYDTSQNVGVMRSIDDKREVTILGNISDVCLPGSIIVTDGHASYQNLPVFGFTHEIVIHEKYFVDPITGVHSNNIENYWQRCKHRLKWKYGTSKRLLPFYLNEFMWFERFGKSLTDTWENTIKLMYRS